MQQNINPPKMLNNTYSGIVYNLRGMAQCPRELLSVFRHEARRKTPYHTLANAGQAHISGKIIELPLRKVHRKGRGPCLHICNNPRPSLTRSHKVCTATHPSLSIASGVSAPDGSLRSHNKGAPRNMNHVREPEALDFAKGERKALATGLESLTGKRYEKGNN